MAEINAKDVMKLRNSTGLPMMDCKAALAEANGNAELAEDILRKKLKGKMEKRAERAAGEGCIAIAVRGDTAAIVELRAETDFTAKNERFSGGAAKIAAMALDAPSDGPVLPTPAMTAIVDDLRISTGENCSLPRARVVKNPGGVFGHYVHHDGKTGVLVVGRGATNPEQLKQVGMHVTAASPVPMGVTPNDIPPGVVERERKFRVEQAIESGKPKEIAEKMVEGGMKKFFAEIALLEQPFIMDQTKTVKEILGSGVTIVGFHRWAVGEEA